MADDTGTLRLRKKRAFDLLGSKHFAEAEAELVALSAQVDDRDVWRQLGRFRLEQGRHSEAAACLRRAVGAGPATAEDHYLLGLATQSSGNRAEAIGCYRQALRLAPDNIELTMRLASAYTGLDDDKAVFFFGKALELQPGHPLATIGLASVHAYKGDAAAAYEVLAPSLRRKPVDLRVAAAFADICRPLQRCREAMELLEGALAGEHDDASRRRAHFALGKLYDRQAEYSRAFDHFAKANLLAHRRYSPAQDAALFEGMISCMDAAFFARAPRARQHGGWKRPVFIVGMPRSGTTLVEQILAADASVHGAGELGELGALVASLPAEVGDALGYPSCLSRLDEQVLDRLAERYVSHVSDISPAAAAMVVDKMPDNFRFLGFVELLFPGARVVHCKRDPIDTCLSCYFQDFEGGHAYSYDLRSLGIYYRMYERLMAHWKSVLGLAIMDVQYEELVEEPERTSRSLLEFCGLEWSPECLRQFDNRRSVMTASFDQVRQPIYRHSVGRWRNYEEYLQPLREGLAQGVVRADR